MKSFHSSEPLATLAARDPGVVLYRVRHAQDRPVEALPAPGIDRIGRSARLGGSKSTIAVSWALRASTLAIAASATSRARHLAAAHRGCDGGRSLIQQIGHLGFPRVGTLPSMLACAACRWRATSIEPVKALLEGQGYSVKGEVRGCDGGGGARPGAAGDRRVEARLPGWGWCCRASMRLALSDTVYLAVGAWPKNMRSVKKLCRRLGLGLMMVGKSVSTSLLDPAPCTASRTRARSGRLLGEHQRRVGDPNRGGSGTPKVPMMTAYRQAALRCAGLLPRTGR